MPKKISQHEEKMLTLQHQMRQNQSELQDYLADLDNWEKDIKQKESQLTDQSKEKSDDLPPVRNTIHKKKLKKKKKEKPVDPNKSKRISGFDFRAWDKFDVDKALEEVDEEKKKKDETSSSEYETDEEWEMERKKHLAGLEKDKGNEFLKKGELEKAIEAYTKGIEFDATNAILPANRAMALLKQQKFAAAELDCTMSISLDPLYVKAYLRRATARSGMNKLAEAIADFNRVLDLEPTNKQAKNELERLQKEIQREKEGPVTSSYREEGQGIVKPIYKPPEERSKVPLRRMVIEEIGIEPSGRPLAASLEQSEVAKKITAKEGEKFDRLFKAEPSSLSFSSPPSATTVAHSVTKPALAAAQAADCSNKITSAESEGRPREKANNVAENVHLVSMKNNERGVLDHTRNIESSKSASETLTCSSESKFSVPNRLSSSEQQAVEKVLPKQNGIEDHSPATSLCGDSAGSGDGFSIPQTSYQFQADFKVLKNRAVSFFQYFKAIPPVQYPKIFGQCLDADILVAILNTLVEFSESGDIDVYDVLNSLTRVKRFSMTAMFLSNKDKLLATKLMEHMEKSGTHSQSEISSLRAKYSL